MWCEYCNQQSPCAQETVRITKDGKEIIIQYCEVCLHRTEIEYYKRPTVRIQTAKGSAKRLS